MGELKNQICNLSIYLPLEEDKSIKLVEIYKSMNGWLGFGDGVKGENGIPYWFSFVNNEKHVCSSVELSGLQFSGLMNNAEWNTWIFEFQNKATKALNQQVSISEEDEF